MKIQILQNGPLQIDLENSLASSYSVTKIHEQADPAAYLALHGGLFPGLVTSRRAAVDRSLIDALPNLKVISSFGVGYERIDVAHAHARGIEVGYTPEVLNDCVADIAFGLLLDVARGMSAADRFVRRGEWPKSNFPLTTSVTGKRLGILGMGRIGRVIAKRASGFDMHVRYHDRNDLHDAAYSFEPTLEGLAEWADFLVVATAGGPTTNKLVSAQVLDSLGPKGFLINISRGTVVDQAALLKALQEKRIAGAGLDVFENEPTVPEPFFALDNVVLLPHVASATHETRDAMAKLVVANLSSFFSTGSAKAAVPK
jgi:hydroxypyruvate reductase